MASNRVAISKMGQDHRFLDKNNQDFLVSLPNVKVVLDGCGSGDHSEVGTRLFGQFLEYNGNRLSEQSFVQTVDAIFERMLSVCKNDFFFFQNFSFTILACFETEDEFVVFACGDGYILFAEHGKDIEFIKLDNGEFPKYYIYNFVTDKDALKEYKEGVEFSIYRFSKEQYANVGVATDGFRFYEGLNNVETYRLFEMLGKGIKAQVGMLINRNAAIFKDDITICF